MVRKKLLINKRLQLDIYLKWFVIPIVLVTVVLYFFKADFWALAVTFCMVVLCAWRILILSHRVAGPIYRLEKDLQEIAKGDFSIRIKFRRKDELQSIADGINKILDEMEKRIVTKKET